jgi:hypothetical protein
MGLANLIQSFKQSLLNIIERSEPTDLFFTEVTNPRIVSYIKKLNSNIILYELNRTNYTAAKSILKKYFSDTAIKFKYYN